MDINLVKALLLIAKLCQAQNNCKQCPYYDFCGKIPSDW